MLKFNVLYSYANNKDVFLTHKESLNLDVKFLFLSILILYELTNLEKLPYTPGIGDDSK
jgi:hypothetical protein